ncbi:MAG: hypothetical protein ACPGNT_11485 [Rhodospirillales bacterium]
MPETVDSLKKLLRTAEQQIVDQARELEQYQTLYQDLMAAQQATDEELVRLTEEIWTLEEALTSTSSENEQALALIRRLRGNIAAVQKQMHDALDAAQNNASRIEMAARVFEMASTPALTEDEKLARQFEEQTRKLRQKVGKKAGQKVGK